MRMQNSNDDRGVEICKIFLESYMLGHQDNPSKGFSPLTIDLELQNLTTASFVYSVRDFELSLSVYALHHLQEVYTSFHHLNST